MKLNIVVPVFNEEEGISSTFTRLSEVAQSLVRENLVTSVELVFVDDGSRDKSSAILRDLIRVDSTAMCVGSRLLQFSRNFGHSAAVFAGLEQSDADLVAIIDADLQDPPELRSEMIKTLKRESAEVVYGQRRMRVGEGPFKKLTAWIFYRLLNTLSGVSIPKDTGDFRIITREVRDTVVSLQEREPFLRGLVAWVGYKQIAFPYDRQPRLLGETKYPFKKMLRFAIQAIVSFSSFPLRLAIYLGAIGMLFSSIISAYAAVIWIEGRALPGWASTIIALSFGQSMTFFLLGIMGLYLGRIHTSSQSRPRYIIRRSET